MNICHWLKVQSRWFKNYIFLDFQILLLLSLHTLLLCHILPFGCGDIFNTIRVSNSLDPDQARHFVRPDLGPNCLQRLSADNKMSGWICVQTVHKVISRQQKKVGRVNTKQTC